MSIKKAVQQNKYFGNNKNLYRGDYQHEYTPHQLEEIVKCASDPAYFIKNYCYIVNPDSTDPILFDLYPYQETLIKNGFLKHKSNIVLFPRQAGKCASYKESVKFRNKSTGEIFEMKIGDFHQWMEFKQWSKKILDK